MIFIKIKMFSTCGKKFPKGNNLFILLHNKYIYTAKSSQSSTGLFNISNFFDIIFNSSWFSFFSISLNGTFTLSIGASIKCFHLSILAYAQQIYNKENILLESLQSHNADQSK